MRLLVTGADGFIGRHFCKLAGSFYDLRPVYRRAAPDRPGALTIPDLTLFEDWPVLLSGVDAVVHCAARAHRPLAVQRAEREDYVRVNTQLSARLCEAAASAGVRHFLFLSTIGVHGTKTRGTERFTEDSPIRPDSPYAETKAEAERQLIAIAQRTGLALTIIRPVLVYGAGAPGNFRTLMRAVDKGLPLPFASIKNRRAFVAVENLVSLMVHRIAANPSGISCFIAADLERVSTPTFVRLISEARRHPARLAPCPPALLRLALSALGRGAMAASLIESLDVDTKKAIAAGWRPAVTLTEGIGLAAGSGHADMR